MPSVRGKVAGLKKTLDEMRLQYKRTEFTTAQVVDAFCKRYTYRKTQSGWNFTERILISLVHAHGRFLGAEYVRPKERGHTGFIRLL